MALFGVEQDKVRVIEAREFANEAALQKLFDDNLEDITGVRLIESQYPIPNGRIDSLGIDEQNTPVVIEYKWGYDAGAIIQGLSYLRWVRENRRAFEMLVREKFGNLKVNWLSPPRLLIIAKQFSDKEMSAIALISASVELRRYSFYGNLLSVEDAIVAPPTRLPKVTRETAVAKEKAEIVEEGKSIEDLVKKTSPALRSLFFGLRDSVLKLGDDVREAVGGWYCDYRKSSTFVSIQPQPRKNRLLLYIKMGDKEIEDPQKWTSPIPPTFNYGKLNTQFQVSDPTQIAYAMELIKQAYDYVP